MADQTSLLFQPLESHPSLLSSDNCQQASDLCDEISRAAISLVNAVEAHAIIRPGLTERTLQDLQMLVDMLEETVRDIKQEPITGSSEEMEVDVDQSLAERSGKGCDKNI